MAYMLYGGCEFCELYNFHNHSQHSNVIILLSIHNNTVAYMTLGVDKQCNWRQADVPGRKYKLLLCCHHS